MNNKKTIFDIISILSLYTLLHYLSMKFCTQVINFEYTQSILDSILHNTNFIIISLIILIITFSSRVTNKWSNYENENIIKIFLFIISFSIFWKASFLDYNYYLNSDLIILKLSIIISAILIFYKPFFVFIFLILSLIMWYSTLIPFGSFGWTGIRPGYEILMLFIIFIMLKRVRNIHTNIFILLAIALHTSNYFIPGIAKIEISPNGWEWAFFNNLNNLFISSYANGWLNFLDENLIIKIAHLLDNIEVVIMLATIIIQIGALFLLYSRKISVIFFIAFELLHIGILIAAGLFFFSWIIVNLGFIYLVKNLPKESLAFLYSKNTFKIFIIVVLFSSLYYKPVPLGWWDAKVHTIYDFYAINENDEKIKLNRNEFAPYDMLFNQNRFYYIDQDNTLVNTRGCMDKNKNIFYSNLQGALVHNIKNYVKMILDIPQRIYQNNKYKVYQKLENAKNLLEVKQIINQYGVNSYNENKKEILKKFLQQYFSNFNKDANNHSFYHNLGMPYHIYDLSTKSLQEVEQIKKVEVYKTNIWWDKEKSKIVKFGYKKIMDINIENN